jgi:hypothetical protein
VPPTREVRVASFVDESLRALREAEQTYALETGRGKHGATPEVVLKRIGYVQGLAAAEAIVRETALRVNKENDT